MHGTTVKIKATREKYTNKMSYNYARQIITWAYVTVIMTVTKKEQ